MPTLVVSELIKTTVARHTKKSRTPYFIGQEDSRCHFSRSFNRRTAKPTDIGNCPLMDRDIINIIIYVTI